MQNQLAMDKLTDGCMKWHARLCIRDAAGYYSQVSIINRKHNVIYILNLIGYVSAAI